MKNSILFKALSLCLCGVLTLIFFASCSPAASGTSQSQSSSQTTSSDASSLPIQETSLQGYTLSHQWLYSPDRFPVDILSNEDNLYFVFQEKLFWSDSASSKLVLEGVQQIAGYDENGLFLIINDPSVSILDNSGISRQMQTSLAYYALSDKSITTLIPGAQSAVIEAANNDIVFYSTVVPYMEDSNHSTRWSIIRHVLSTGSETVLYTDNYKDFLPFDSYATENDHSYDILLSTKGGTPFASIFFPYPSEGNFSIEYTYNWEGTLLEKFDQQMEHTYEPLKDFNCGNYTVSSKTEEYNSSNYYSILYYMNEPSTLIGKGISTTSVYTNHKNLFYYYRTDYSTDNGSGWAVFNGKNSDFLTIDGSKIDRIYASENTTGNQSLYANITVFNETYTAYTSTFYRLVGTTENPTAAEQLFSLSGTGESEYDIYNYHTLPAGNFMLFLTAEPLNFVALNVTTNEFTAYKPELLA